MDTVTQSDVQSLYDSYQNGDADLTKVNRITRLVNSYLEAVTFGRLSGDITDSARLRAENCANELVEFLVKQEFEPDVSSESVADWSRTYAHAADTSVRQEMYAITCRWLSGTGLMYCGV